MNSTNSAAQIRMDKMEKDSHEVDPYEVIYAIALDNKNIMSVDLDKAFTPYLHAAAYCEAYRQDLELGIPVDVILANIEISCLLDSVCNRSDDVDIADCIKAVVTKNPGLVGKELTLEVFKEISR